MSSHKKKNVRQEFKKKMVPWFLACFILVSFLVVFSSPVFSRVLDIIVGGSNAGLECKTDEECGPNRFCNLEQYYCIACKVPMYEWTGTECKCPADRPVETEDDKCVQCLDLTDCKGSEMFCNTDSNTCAQCKAPKEWKDNACVCPVGSHAVGDTCECNKPNSDIMNMCMCTLTPTSCANTDLNLSECICCPASAPVNEGAECKSCAAIDPSKPVWDETIKACRQVCAAPTPILDPETGLCVECLINTDCPVDMMCNSESKICEFCPEGTYREEGTEECACLKCNDVCCPENSFICLNNATCHKEVTLYSGSGTIKVLKKGTYKLLMIGGGGAGNTGDEWRSGGITPTKHYGYGGSGGSGRVLSGEAAFDKDFSSRYEVGAAGAIRVGDYGGTGGTTSFGNIKALGGTGGQRRNRDGGGLGGKGGKSSGESAFSFVQSSAMDGAEQYPLPGITGYGDGDGGSTCQSDNCSDASLRGRNGLFKMTVCIGDDKGGLKCVGTECSKEKPLIDHNNECQACSYPYSINYGTDQAARRYCVEKCKGSGTERIAQNGNCVKSNCTAARPIQDGEGACYACDTTEVLRMATVSAAEQCVDRCADSFPRQASGVLCLPGNACGVETPLADDYGLCYPCSYDGGISMIKRGQSEQLVDCVDKCAKSEYPRKIKDGICVLDPVLQCPPEKPIYWFDAGTGEQRCYECTEPVGVQYKTSSDMDRSVAAKKYCVDVCKNLRTEMSGICGLINCPVNYFKRSGGWNTCIECKTPERIQATTQADANADVAQCANTPYKRKAIFDGWSYYTVPVTCPIDFPILDFMNNCRACSDPEGITVNGATLNCVNKCPVGMRQGIADATGSDKVCILKTCPAGMLRDKNSECFECSRQKSFEMANQTSLNTATTSCKGARFGRTSSSGFGTTYFSEPCRANTYNPNGTSAKSCTSCPVDKSTLSNETYCTQCEGIWNGTSCKNSCASFVATPCSLGCDLETGEGYKQPVGTACKIQEENGFCDDKGICVIKNCVTDGGCSGSQYCETDPIGCSNPIKGVCVGRPSYNSGSGAYSGWVVSDRDMSLDDAKNFCSSFGKSLVTRGDLGCSGSNQGKVCVNAITKALTPQFPNVAVWTASANGSCQGFAVILFDGTVGSSDRTHKFRAMCR